MEPSISSSSSDVISEKRLKIWKIFRNVGPEGEEILKTAKLAHSAAYNRALVVTQTDETYSFYRYDDDVCKISKIPELCGVQVEEFITGTINFARTGDGQLFSWYWCGRPVPNLTGVKVRQIAVSRCEGIVALSEGGNVHQWGSTRGPSRYLAPVTAWAPIPKEHFDNQDVTLVACVEHTGFALTSKGELYHWILAKLDWMENGQPSLPSKILTAGSVPFKKIIGGSDFIAALTVTGELRYFKVNFPSRIPDGEEWKTVSKEHKIRDIASCNWPGNVFVIELNTQARFAFSSRLPEASHVPSLTLPSSLTMEELFAQYGDTSHQTFSTRGGPETGNRASDVLRNLWENKKLADVAFSVEGRLVPAHRCVLAERSEYFESMFTHEWKEAEGAGSAIEVKDTKHAVFEALLFYIYCDEIKFKEDEDENIFELMKLADFYCQVNLRNECEKILIGNINEENAFFFARNASSVNASTLEEKAMKFIADYQLVVDNSSPERKTLWGGFLEKMSAALLKR